MHVISRELATPGNPPIYPMIDINGDVLRESLTDSISQANQSKNIAIHEIRIANILSNRMHPSVMHTCLYTLISFHQGAAY